ncbi:hypothetical protein F4808DRAFT_148294 [Astrocystis sublimbata]|nr:hypothetical protein F4808DRAFT_148294 [Astrocystis sublimbata]
MQSAGSPRYLSWNRGRGLSLSLTSLALHWVCWDPRRGSTTCAMVDGVALPTDSLRKPIVWNGPWLPPRPYSIFYHYYEVLCETDARVRTGSGGQVDGYLCTSVDPGFSTFIFILMPLNLEKFRVWSVLSSRCRPSQRPPSSPSFHVHVCSGAWD